MLSIERQHSTNSCRSLHIWGEASGRVLDTSQIEVIHDAAFIVFQRIKRRLRTIPRFLTINQHATQRVQISTRRPIRHPKRQRRILVAPHIERPRPAPRLTRHALTVPHNPANTRPQTAFKKLVQRLQPREHDMNQTNVKVLVTKIIKHDNTFQKSKRRKLIGESVAATTAATP